MKSALKKLAILAAPIIWRKLRGRHGRHHWHRGHRWHGGHHRHRRHHGHKRPGVWL